MEPRTEFRGSIAEAPAYRWGMAYVQFPSVTAVERSIGFRPIADLAPLVVSLLMKLTIGDRVFVLDSYNWARGAAATVLPHIGQNTNAPDGVTIVVKTVEDRRSRYGSSLTSRRPISKEPGHTPSQIFLRQPWGPCFPPSVCFPPMIAVGRLVSLRLKADIGIAAWRIAFLSSLHPSECLVSPVWFKYPVADRR